MAYDPLHKPKTRKERRQIARDACKIKPCVPVEKLLLTGKGEAPCVICIHEGKL